MNFSKEFKLINLTQKFQDILGIDAVKAEKISRYITEDKEDDDVSENITYDPRRKIGGDSLVTGL